MVIENKMKELNAKKGKKNTLISSWCHRYGPICICIKIMQGIYIYVWLIMTSLLFMCMVHFVVLRRGI
jgi:sensor histidine kinase YesM